MLSAPLRIAASTRTVPHAEGGDQPVAGQEPHPHGGAARRQLRDDGAVCRQVLDEVAVAGRVGAVDPARQHRDRGAVQREGTAMGGLVDAERGARHHRASVTGQPGSDLAGGRLAVGRGGAGADDRDGPSQLVQAQPDRGPTARTARPTIWLTARRSGEVVELRRPLGIGGDHEADAASRRLLELARGIDRGERGPRRRPSAHARPRLRQDLVVEATGTGLATRRR